MQSELGDVGAYVVRSQCKLLGIDPENIQGCHVARLVSTLSEASSNFGDEKSRSVYQKLMELESASRREGSGDARVLDDFWNLGEASRFAGETGEAVKYYSMALDLAKEKGDAALAVRVLMKISEIFLNSGNYEQAAKYLRDCHAMAAAHGDPKLSVDVARLLGSLHWRMGKLDKAHEVLEGALARAREIGYESGEAHVNLTYANIHQDRGEHEESMQRYLEALKIFGAIGDLESTARIYNNIGVSFLRRGQHAKSLEFFEKCVAVSRKIGHAFLEGWALFNAAEDLVHLGDFEKAAGYADQSLEIFKRLGDSLGLSGVYSTYGIIFWKQKDYVRSKECFEESVALRRKLKMPFRLANACLEFGEMLAETGDSEAAREYLEEALEISEKMGQAEMVEKARKLLASL